MLIKNDCKQKKNGYGMTESSPLITVNLPEDSLEKRTNSLEIIPNGRMILIKKFFKNLT